MIEVMGENNFSQIGNADESCRLAFKKVAKAEKAGANVVDLVEPLNKAINLTTQAKIMYGHGNFVDAHSFAGQAIVMCTDIMTMAEQLERNATQLELFKRIVAFGSAPIIALITTFVLFRVLKWWRNREIDLILDKEIRKRG